MHKIFDDSKSKLRVLVVFLALFVVALFSFAPLS